MPPLTLTIRTAPILRKIRSLGSILSATIRRQRFLCDSLQGSASPGVCVNSDFLLSCGCRDSDGTGHIGNLSKTSFEEAFHGETANRFRQHLANGILPTAHCAGCTHLRLVSPEEAAQVSNQQQLPTSIMLENTSACNLQCVSCNRELVRQVRRRRIMGLDNIERLSREVSQMGVREITYHHMGEPFLSKQIGEELQVIRRHNPDIRLVASTNGMLLNTPEKREAAMLLDHIQISLDGINQSTAARYQRGIDFERVYENMKTLVAHRNAAGGGPAICWKYLLFRWNERRTHLLRAVELAEAAGVDEIWFERTLSPLHGIPWRTCLGANRDIGIRDGNVRYVAFGSPTAKNEHAEEGACAVAATTE